MGVPKNPSSPFLAASRAFEVQRPSLARKEITIMPPPRLNWERDFRPSSLELLGIPGLGIVGIFREAMMELLLPDQPWENPLGHAP